MGAAVDRHYWLLEVHQMVLSSLPDEALFCCGSSPSQPWGEG